MTDTTSPKIDAVYYALVKTGEYFVINYDAKKHQEILIRNEIRKLLNS